MYNIECYYRKNRRVPVSKQFLDSNNISAKNVKEIVREYKK